MKNGSARRTVVVTGAASGIGRATALTLARAGFHVLAGVRRPADGEALEREGQGRIEGLLLDVTSADSVRDAASRVAERVGAAGLYGLVNNAGVGSSCPIEFQPIEELRAVYDVNVFGVVTVTQALLPLLRAAGGRIVNIGSVGDRFPIPFGAALCSSKAAIRTVTEVMRLELHALGVHVCLVQPTSIATPAVKKFEDEATRRLASLPADADRLYGTQYHAFVKRASVEEQKGSPPEVVALAVRDALTARRPRSRRLVGKGAGLFGFLTTFVPDRALDLMRYALFGMPLTFGALAAARTLKGRRRDEVKG